MFSLIITLANSIYLNNISEKGTKKSKTTKQNIILLNSSIKLTKLKSLIKFYNQPVVPWSWTRFTVPKKMLTQSQTMSRRKKS